MRLLLAFTLSCCIISFTAHAQGTSQGMVAYKDTLNGYSFFLPSWFTVTPSSNINGPMIVKESGEFSFEFYTIGIKECNINDDYDEYVGKYDKDSGDNFLEAAKRKIFYSCANYYHGLVGYGRLDSVKEFQSVGGLRVLAAYRRQVDIKGDPIDYYQIGPLYIVDIPAAPNDRLLVFDFSWFDLKNSVYRELALSIALSVQQI